MGQLKLHPSQTNPDAARKLLRFLLKRQASGKFPYDVLEPGLMLERGIRRYYGELGREGLARLLFGHVQVDVRRDSIGVAARVVRSFEQNFHLYRPATFDAGDLESVRRIVQFAQYMEAGEFESTVHEMADEQDCGLSGVDTTNFIRKDLGHHCWPELAYNWVSNYLRIQEQWDGSVLNLLNGNRSAGEVLRSLTETRVVDVPSHKTKGGKVVATGTTKNFLGFGSKVARLFILRSAKLGICNPKELAEIGVPIDIHAIVLFGGNGAIDLTRPELASTVKAALHALLGEVCQRWEFDPVEAYQSVWTWGRRMCRPVRCRVCPLGLTKKCKGRMATGGYYSAEGPRYVGGEVVIDPRNPLDFPLEVLAPELYGGDDSDYDMATLQSVLLGGEQPSLPWLADP